ncbi:MAG: CARDB domain-containing protein, partial [Thermoplasmatota archaeon]
QTMLVSQIPSLWFWYRVEGYTAQSQLDYTLMTAGSPDRSLTISMSELTADGAWHQYVIDADTLSEWRSGAGTLTGIELRLTANAEGGENTLYIDDLGYSFMPGQGGIDRRNWQLPDFYTFAAAADTGMWTLRITMTDSAGYRVTDVASISVAPAANLNVVDVSAPAGIKEGETAAITVTVANDGRKDVAASPPVNVSVSLSQGDTLVKLVKGLGTLAAGASKDITFTWRASYGAPAENGRWQIRAEANKDNVIPETNKADNWNVQSIEVTPRPDLEVHMYDIGFTPLHPDANETVNISVLLHNTGYMNTTATLQFLVRAEGASRYTLIPNGTVERIIGKQVNETVFATWTPSENGTYALKVVASCEEESRTENNQAIKNIRVGGPADTLPPIISSVRISNTTRFRGDPINITANIRDNETTIDEAIVVISGDDGDIQYPMYRLGDTNIYYYNASFNTVGYYTCMVEAYDTGGDGTGRRNRDVSDSVPFRVVHEGVETTPPSIAGVAAVPERQVIGEPVNISVAIQDEHPLHKVLLYVIGPTGGTSTYTMTGTGGSYHYARSYETPGEYSCYVEAIDASANRNKNDTADSPISFTIPVDYDSDGIPDSIEREAGANPRERGDNVNVSVPGAMGYLLWKMDAEEYVYWDVEAGQLRSVETDVIDGFKVILFDADGDGEYDHYYDEDNQAIRTYTPPADEDTGAIIWAVPAAILFALVCIMFVFIRRKA